MLISVKYINLPLSLTVALTHKGMRFNEIALAVQKIFEAKSRSEHLFANSHNKSPRLMLKINKSGFQPWVHKAREQRFQILMPGPQASSPTLLISYSETVCEVPLKILLWIKVGNVCVYPCVAVIILCVYTHSCARAGPEHEFHVGASKEAKPCLEKADLATSQDSLEYR